MPIQLPDDLFYKESSQQVKGSEVYKEPKIVLSILIPTVVERRDQFNRLALRIFKLLDEHKAWTDVQLLHLRDNKEMTIGEKREQLYKMAEGKYSWQIDDDDDIDDEAISLILEAAKENPDCITFGEACNIDGVESRSNFSLKYNEWGTCEDGFDHVRTPFFKTPILTTICQQVPVPHIRFGEDHWWAQEIKPLLKTEVHIDRYLYKYIHRSSPFKERYGYPSENL